MFQILSNLQPQVGLETSSSTSASSVLSLSASIQSRGEPFFDHLNPSTYNDSLDMNALRSFLSQYIAKPRHIWHGWSWVNWTARYSHFRSARVRRPPLMVCLILLKYSISITGAINYHSGKLDHDRAGLNSGTVYPHGWIGWASDTNLV